MVCVEHLAGVAGVHPVDRNRIPGCTYSRPQVASIGLTEAQARASGHPVSVGTFGLRHNGKAIAAGHTTGFVKVVTNSATRELLGAHMIGHEVTEMIQGFGIAAHLEATDTELADVMFAHPTMSEAMHESVLAAMGRPLHQ